MRMVATLVGGGLLAVIGLAIARALLGGVVGLTCFVFGLVFKLLLVALAVWLGIRLLKSLVPPAKET